jgi:hypothetical protein
MPIHLSLNFSTKLNVETTVMAQKTLKIFHYQTYFSCGATAQIGPRPLRFLAHKQIDTHTR